MPPAFDPSEMKAKTVDEFTPVYSLPDATVNVMFELAAGEELTVTGNSNPSWVSITTLDGRIGYIPRKSHLFPIREVALKQHQAAVMAQPDHSSQVIYTMLKGETFIMNGVLKNEAGEWVEIKYIGNQTGFIQGSTKIKKVISKETAYKNMGIGALISIIGIVVSVGSYDSVVKTGGAYIIALGAILFGVIRFFRGAAQLY